MLVTLCKPKSFIGLHNAPHHTIHTFLGLVYIQRIKAFFEFNNISTRKKETVIFHFSLFHTLKKIWTRTIF